MKKIFLAQRLGRFFVLVNITAVACEIDPPLRTIGDYVNEFEARTAMVKHRIELLDFSKSPTGLDHPYFIWHGDFWSRLLRKTAQKQALCTLTIEQFVKAKFTFACKLTNITTIPKPTPYDVQLVVTTLKKQLNHMLEQRATELDVYRQQIDK